jgi:putative RNA 2'-phosphotransferase
MKLNDKKFKKISKYLSFLLRHHPEEIGLKLDENGWADIDEIIKKTLNINITKNDIIEVVLNNDKKRFDLNEDISKIRANQGHSIDVDLELELKIPAEILFHGTAVRFIDSILEKGIIPKQRQYVHLSLNKETALKVGSRHGKPVVLKIKTYEMFKDGFSFYLSKNNVWLTKIIHQKYIVFPK